MDGPSSWTFRLCSGNLAGLRLSRKECRVWQDLGSPEEGHRQTVKQKHVTHRLSTGTGVESVRLQNKHFPRMSTANMDLRHGTSSQKEMQLWSTEKAREKRDSSWRGW